MTRRSAVSVSIVETRELQKSAQKEQGLATMVFNHDRQGSSSVRDQSSRNTTARRS